MRKQVLDVIVAKAHFALERHKAAKASGDKRATADARRDLESSREALTKAREELDAVGAIAKTLRSPVRLGSHGWLR